MEEVVNFLTANGLIQNEMFVFENEKCKVLICPEWYEVEFLQEKGYMSSKDHNIYWLIGVLTYYGFIDKNYNQSHES